jgi:hypothetical protein
MHRKEIHLKARTLAFALALSSLATLTAVAQATYMGTWKMDEARSKVPANSVKNPTVTYEMAGDNIKCTTDGVDANGNPQHTEWTGKFDGKDYPLTGETGSDSRAYTMVNDHKLTFVSKKGANTSVRGTITLSADGKTRTLKTTAPDAAGKKVSSTAIYTKQ